MSDLIAALQIFLKYGDPEWPWPTTCLNETLYINDINPTAVTETDKKKLEGLGFHAAGSIFKSTRFGSA